MPMKAQPIDPHKLLREVSPDYQFNASVMSDDSPKVATIKWRLDHLLNPAERNTIILYAELGSIREVAKILNVSKSFMADKINEIKNKLKKQ